MPHYKTAENKLYWLDSAEYEHFLPAGLTKITDAEADAIRAAELALLPNPRIAAIKTALDEIDRKSVRAIRENDAARMANWNTQAAALRAELATL